jgi:hypothetical protein
LVFLPLRIRLREGLASLRRASHSANRADRSLGALLLGSHPATKRFLVSPPAEKVALPNSGISILCRGKGNKEENNIIRLSLINIIDCDRNRKQQKRRRRKRREKKQTASSLLHRRNRLEAYIWY